MTEQVNVYGGEFKVGEIGHVNAHTEVEAYLFKLSNGGVMRMEVAKQLMQSVVCEMLEAKAFHLEEEEIFEGPGGPTRIRFSLDAFVVREPSGLNRLMGAIDAAEARGYQKAVQDIVAFIRAREKTYESEAYGHAKLQALQHLGDDILSLAAIGKLSPRGENDAKE